MEREDTLTCLLSGVSSIPTVNFSHVKESDVRCILEIYDNIGGKGTISGLVGGETGFGLLLIEAVMSAACGVSSVSAREEGESKEERSLVEESKSEGHEGGEVPPYLLELISRYGVAEYCQNLMKEGVLGDFELKRTVARVSDLFIKCDVNASGPTKYYRNEVVEDLLSKLKEGDLLSCNYYSIQEMDGQITQAMDLGYRFAFLLAQPSGVHMPPTV